MPAAICKVESPSFLQLVGKEMRRGVIDREGSEGGEGEGSQTQ